MALAHIREDQQVALASTFLQGQVLQWWSHQQDTVRDGTLPAYTRLQEMFNGLDAQFVPRDAWQIAHDKLVLLYQKGSVA